MAEGKERLWEQQTEKRSDDGVQPVVGELLHCDGGKRRAGGRCSSGAARG